jgi:tyrosyl-tRNA synthetase
LQDKPEDAYGKLMSISDTLMWRYYVLLLEKSAEQIVVMQTAVQDGSVHPKDLKKQMAYGVIDQFWSRADADKAQAHFESLFEQKNYAQAQEIILPKDLANPCKIVDLLKILVPDESSSQLRRLITDGAVSIDTQKITDVQAFISYEKGMVVKVGKHKIFQIA